MEKVFDVSVKKIKKKHTKIVLRLIKIMKTQLVTY